jgi:josephin
MYQRIAVTKVNDIYYNLDSKLDTPERIGDENKLFEYLENLVKSKDKELFVIIPREIELDGSWRH